MSKAVPAKPTTPATGKTEKVPQDAQTLRASFKNVEWFDRALRHRSLGPPHNEVLEWLGDALLYSTISAYLYRRYPDASEGVLSHLRNTLVSNATLRTLYKTLPLEPMVNDAMVTNPQFNPEDQYADLFEAMLGAVYVDRGIKTCEQYALHWCEPLFKQLPANPTVPELKSAVTRLKEYAEQLPELVPHGQRPTYTSQPAQDAKQVRVLCVLHTKISPDPIQEEGVGDNKTMAKNAAAEKVLQSLQRLAKAPAARRKKAPAAKNNKE